MEGFLYKAQQDWKELKRISVSDLMFVKEDIIVPHHYTFYDLIGMQI
jgi:protein FAM50